MYCNFVCALFGAMEGAKITIKLHSNNLGKFAIELNTYSLRIKRE
jgi:hypothetical protein